MKLGEKFQFGEFQVDPLMRTLRRSEEVVTLNRRAFDVLIYLIQNPGRVLSRDELLKNVWPDTFVDENSLAQSISSLRRALEEKPGDNSYIVTLPGRGYQFVSQVKVIAPPDLSITPDAGGEGNRPAGLLLQRETIRTSIATSELPTLPSHRRARGLIIALCLVVLILGGALYHRVHPAHHLTQRDTVVLADFSNRTGDPVFDDTLKTALGITLDQSAFLNTLSDNKVRRTLRLMARPVDTRITSDVAREICQRAGGKAFISGAIAQLGRQYVVTLDAASCQDGDTMAREQVTAAAKEEVLDALGTAASKLRSELGGSLVTAQKFDVTLRQATTPSLEALKAYSVGMKLQFQQPPSAQQYFDRALELDPNFAMAYVELGNTYFALNQFGRARECITKAFALRDRTSELERLQIAAEYYAYVTGELEKSLQALQQDIEYKRDSVYIGLADVYSRLGQNEKAAEAARTLVARDPDFSFGFGSLASDDLALQDFTGVRQVVQEVQARGVDSYSPHYYLYRLAFLQGDSAGMTDQLRWFAGQPVYEGGGLTLQADTEAYAGHLKKARELIISAAESAIREGNKQNAAMYRANGALQEAAYGSSVEGRQSAAEALRLGPGNPNVAVQAALAFAMTGDVARATSLLQDLGKRFPLDTQMQLLGIPPIQAQLELGQGQPELALNALRAGLPIEYASIPFSDNISCLYSTYLRGQAYLAARQGAAAAGEFQKIIDHTGIVGNCWTGALAHLGVGRANALLSTTSQGDQGSAARAQAVDAYNRFLILWKDADPEIPILKEAKAEYAKLK